MALTSEAKREYNRNWMKRRRQAFLDSRGGRCEKCGSSDRLEVDHIDPSKKLYYPRDIWSRRAEVREAELAKCQVLCYACHSEKTTIEQSTSVHGTRSKYNSGCRCAPCTLSNRTRLQEYRRR